jgi:hypothetical protein
MNTDQQKIFFKEKYTFNGTKQMLVYQRVITTWITIILNEKTQLYRYRNRTKKFFIILSFSRFIKRKIIRGKKCGGPVLVFSM